jgi:uncharacterized protein (DUF924 family)
MTSADVLAFWFDTTDLGARVPPERARRWFTSDPAFDDAIRARFGALLDAPGTVEGWAADPAGTLAAVLVLDQFPRNLFRGTARAFATDPRALALARGAVAAGHDAAMGLQARCFLYLPFEHAEDAAAQAEAIGLFDAMLAGAAPDEQALARSFADFARQHEAIVARFGRFPGRNKALGRADTPEEAAWLASGGPTFGQR